MATRLSRRKCDCSLFIKFSFVLICSLTYQHRFQHVRIRSLACHHQFLSIQGSVPRCHDPFLEMSSSVPSCHHLIHHMATSVPCCRRRSGHSALSMTVANFTHGFLNGSRSVVSPISFIFRHRVTLDCHSSATGAKLNEASPLGLINLPSLTRAQALSHRECLYKPESPNL